MSAPQPPRGRAKQEPSERPLIDAIERPEHVPIVDAAGEFFGFAYEGDQE